RRGDAGLDRRAKPLALVFLLEVLELVGQRSAVEVAHMLHDVGGGALVIAERLGGNLEKIRLGDSVKFRLELRRAGRLRPQRVEGNGEVPVTLNRDGQRRRRRGLPEK